MCEMTMTKTRRCGSTGYYINLLVLLIFGFLSFSALCTAQGSLHPDSNVRVERDSKSHAWTYDGKTGEDHWPEMFKACGADDQSPINIDTSEADLNDNLDEFDFDNYNDDLDDAVIKNNGHTVAVFPKSGDDHRTIEEGGMDDTYEFVQLHFHWGSDSKKGSEHTINGKRFPLEMHLVHRNMKYKTMEAATKKEDGLAVLGVLFKISAEDNEAFEPIIDKLDDVKHKGDQADLDDLDLMALLPDDLMPYYRYRGSLTTPPCSEVVTWTIFADYVHISEKQMQQFRNLLASESGKPDEDLDDNYRNVQPLHGRVIEVSPDESSSSASFSVSSPVVFLALAIALTVGRKM